MKKLLIATAVLASVNVNAATPADLLETCKNIVSHTIRLDMQIQDERVTLMYASRELRPSLEVTIEGYQKLQEGNRLLWQALECELVYELYADQFKWNKQDE